jgi:hypothetical protein
MVVSLSIWLRVCDASVRKASERGTPAASSVGELPREYHKVLFGNFVEDPGNGRFYSLFFNFGECQDKKIVGIQSVRRPVSALSLNEADLQLSGLVFGLILKLWH